MQLEAQAAHLLAIAARSSQEDLQGAACSEWLFNGGTTLREWGTAEKRRARAAWAS